MLLKKNKLTTASTVISRHLLPYEEHAFSLTTSMRLSGNPSALSEMRAAVSSEVFDETSLTQFVDTHRELETVGGVINSSMNGSVYDPDAQDPTFDGNIFSVSSGGSNIQYKEKEFRETITSLDIEKDRTILNCVEIPPPWSVGLIVNLASRYNSRGVTLHTKEKVKSLTVVFLTCKTKGDLEKQINTKSTASRGGSVNAENFNSSMGPMRRRKRRKRRRRRRNEGVRDFTQKVDTTFPTLQSLRAYAGFLQIVFMMSGFPSFSAAKDAFLCCKQHTRGPRSRMNCIRVVYDLFVEHVDGCGELIYHSVHIPPEMSIPMLHNLQ